MRQAARPLVTALAAISLGAALFAPSASAQIEWKPCGDSNDVACGHLTVALDPATPSAGTGAACR